ncbi:SpoIID/LytB domain-containing protein [Sporomusa sp.]|jgi:stage II sporulation protein D|uniref:SpoIID/LytB domain-containing protein n=1 Tax=Sporomusa sp. TaxID=2078658 RepID=UPI002CCA233D|nr:SpoIID/LytB domain-containing protein [Sporomusa sp.]MDF2876713.1 SpoIID/LytB domain protein [Sporomusa sp.]HWR09440.1 SpoIID/LytB domain-containing protein [Sporomusa sp.]
MNRKSIICFAVFVCLCLALAGCNNQPLKKPETPQMPQNPSTPKQAAQQNEPDITVFMHETGEKKTMKMEEYIAGVVAGEMKNDWPVQALAAQAIIARTFTVEAIETKGGVPDRGTQASTDIKEFQAYSAKDVNDNVKKAVQMTRGMVITYQGKPIKGWFHASAGGITATAKEGLNYRDAEPPYIQSVQSPDDLAPEDVKKWTIVFPKENVIAAMNKVGKKVSDISSIEIGQKGPSGRATMLKINKNVEVSGPELRVALDSTKLKSMLLDKIEVSEDSVTFAGKGYGHGVGMSQWGANSMAKDGKQPEEIVTHYFKDVKVEKRWN